MVIKKTVSKEKTKETTKSKLSNYNKQATAFLSVNIKREKRTVEVMKSSLATLIPLAAASLSPFVMQGQACATAPPGAAAIENLSCGENAATLDLDGGGVDLVFLYTGDVGGTTGGLLVRQATAASMTFARTTYLSYRYLVGYAPGATINELSGSFGALKSQPGGTNCTNTNAYGWLDYEKYGTGGWHGLTGDTRVMGLTKDGFLGFVEITYNDDLSSGNYSIGEFGLSTDAADTQITAGDCTSLPVELTRFFGKEMA